MPCSVDLCWKKLFGPLFMAVTCRDLWSFMASWGAFCLFPPRSAFTTLSCVAWFRPYPQAGLVGPPSLIGWLLSPLPPSAICLGSAAHRKVNDITSPRTGVFCNSAMEALSRDPDIVAISHEATYIREHLSLGLHLEFGSRKTIVSFDVDVLNVSQCVFYVSRPCKYNDV